MESPLSNRTIETVRLLVRKENAIPPGDTEQQFNKTTMQAKLSFSYSQVKRSPLKPKAASKCNILKATRWPYRTRGRQQRIGTTSYAWTIHGTRMRCMAICECCVIPRPPLKDRTRTMKMAAAAYYGSDVQVCTKESIAQDSGDGIDSYGFCELLIFQVFCGC